MEELPKLTLETLAAQQALEIANLKRELSECKEDMRSISLSLCCIGGPLNDNALGYSPEQRKPLHRINSIAEAWCDD